MPRPARWAGVEEEGEGEGEGEGGPERPLLGQLISLGTGGNSEKSVL